VSWWLTILVFIKTLSPAWGGATIFIDRQSLGKGKNNGFSRLILAKPGQQTPMQTTNPLFLFTYKI
jgi:hypothetical protein